MNILSQENLNQEQYLDHGYSAEIVQFTTCIFILYSMLHVLHSKLVRKVFVISLPGGLCEITALDEKGSDRQLNFRCAIFGIHCGYICSPPPPGANRLLSIPSYSYTFGHVKKGTSRVTLVVHM